MDELQDRADKLYRARLDMIEAIGVLREDGFGWEQIRADFEDTLAEVREDEDQGDAA